MDVHIKEMFPQEICKEEETAGNVNVLKLTIIITLQAIHLQKEKLFWLTGYEVIVYKKIELFLSCLCRGEHPC